MNHINDKSIMEIQKLLSEDENSYNYIDLAQSTIYIYLKML